MFALFSCYILNVINFSLTIQYLSNLPLDTFENKLLTTMGMIVHFKKCHYLKI